MSRQRPPRDFRESAVENGDRRRRGGGDDAVRSSGERRDRGVDVRLQADARVEQRPPQDGLGAVGRLQLRRLQRESETSLGIDRELRQRRRGELPRLGRARLIAGLGALRERPRGKASVPASATSASGDDQPEPPVAPSRGDALRRERPLGLVARRATRARPARARRGRSRTAAARRSARGRGGGSARPRACRAPARAAPARPRRTARGRRRRARSSSRTASRGG